MAELSNMRAVYQHRKHCQVETQENYSGHHFQTIRKLAKNVFYTTERLLIIYSNLFLQKNVSLPHVRIFTLIYGPYIYLIDDFFGPILMENFVCFFKCLLNVKAHAL